MVNADNEENWLWFLEHLKYFLMNRYVVLISDRNPSLILAANKVFGSGYDAQYLNRLKESLNYFISSNQVLKMEHLKSALNVKVRNQKECVQNMV